jgi:HSP20 family molecular chaperone IbpA
LNDRKEAAMTAMKTAGLAHSFPPQADVVETVDHYLVELDVSDFALEELEVVVDGEWVSVVGVQEARRGDEPAFQLHERLEERFRLPQDSDPAGLTAVFEYGTLDLSVPKRPDLKPERRIVPIRKRRHGLINADAAAV